jgi:ectoine hydroxylase-related dioxygenase (phytanoyl-CoA dioxygenase family)
VSKDSGAVEYIRGSHKWDRWFQPETFGKTSVHSYEQNPDYEPMPDIDANRGDYDILSWDMEPGDALAFHALTVHGAGGNTRQDRRRRGYAVRYTGEDVRYDPRPGTSKVLHDEGLAAGELMDSKRFPVVWQANDSSRGETKMGETNMESVA